MGHGLGLAGRKKGKRKKGSCGPSLERGRKEGEKRKKDGKKRRKKKEKKEEEWLGFSFFKLYFSEFRFLNCFNYLSFSFDF